MCHRLFICDGNTNFWQDILCIVGCTVTSTELSLLRNEVWVCVRTSVAEIVILYIEFKTGKLS